MEKKILPSRRTCDLLPTPHLFDVYNITSPRRVSHHTLSINKAIKKMDERSNEKSILLPTTQMDSSLLTSKRMHVPSRKGLHTVSREKRKAILVAQTLISNTVKVMTEDDPSDLAVKTHNTHLVAYQQLTGVSSAPHQYSDQDCPACLFHYAQEHFWKPNPHLHLGTKECKARNPDPATRN